MSLTAALCFQIDSMYCSFLAVQLFRMLTRCKKKKKKSLIYWTSVLYDPTQPSAVMSSLGDGHVTFGNSAGSLLQGMTSSPHEVCWLARLCDVTTHAPMTRSVARPRRCLPVRCSTVGALWWRRVRLAASALWPCTAQSNGVIKLFTIRNVELHAASALPVVFIEVQPEAEEPQALI